MLRRSACSMLAVVAGCAGHAGQAGGSSAPRPLPIIDGIYRFTERPAQTQLVIDGRMTVLGDSVIVDAQPGPCRLDSSTRAGGPFVYQCGEVTITVDRYNPVRNASYRTTTMVVTRRLVCVRYTTDSSGRQTCAQQETQTTETQVPVGGALHFERIVKDGRGRGGPRG